MIKRCLICFFLILGSICFSEEQFSFTFEDMDIYLETSISQVLGIMGEPENIEIHSFSANSNWDTFIYKYDGVWVYKYRKPQEIYRFFITDKLIPVKIKTFTIFVGESQTEVEEKLGNGYRYDNKDGKEYTIIYEFKDYINVEITYTNAVSPVVTGILIGFATP